MKYDRQLACIGLGKSCNAIAELCNNSAEKQNRITHELNLRLKKIEKERPARCYFQKEWRHLFGKFCVSINRADYYIQLSKRALQDSTEYLERAK